MIVRDREGSMAGRRARRRLGLIGCVLGGLVIGTSSASAADGSDGEVWHGFSLFADAGPHVIVQRAKGSAGSSFGVSGEQANIVTNMNFRLGGIKGPTLEFIPGRPRAVVWAAALLPLNESSTIGTAFIEGDDPNVERIELTKFTIEYKTSALAGVGLEFEIPVLDSEIHVTPAVEMLHLEGRYTGEIALDSNFGGVQTNFAVRRKTETTQHFVGPTLRVATPTFVFRDAVAIDFSLDTSLLVDVAGTRETFGGVGENGGTGRFSMETGSGVIQVGLSLQVRWP